MRCGSRSAPSGKPSFNWLRECTVGVIERANRCGVAGAELWQLDLGEVAHARKALKRHLILEPWDLAHVTQLNAWVEEQRIRYIWETETIDERPKGPAKYEIYGAKLDNTNRDGCAGIPAIGYTVIRALARGGLGGDLAVEAMHGLFWAAFVENTEGLRYLHRHASETVGNHYAQQRLDWSLRRELGKRSGTLEGDIKNPVAKLLDEATRAHAPMLGVQAWQRAAVDDAFYEALEAIAAIHPVDARNKQTLQFLKLHKSKRPRDPSSE